MTSRTFAERALKENGFWIMARAPRFRIAPASSSKLYPLDSRTRAAGSMDWRASKVAPPPRPGRLCPEARFDPAIGASNSFCRRLWKIAGVGIKVEKNPTKNQHRNETT
jgi:hypothetical protein